MKIKKLICYFFGHNRYGIAEDHGCAECLRCGAWNYGSELEGEEFYLWRRKIWWKLTNRIRQRYNKIKCKIRAKFIKEDDSIPF